MSDIKDFKDLLVWQKAIALNTQIYRMTKLFPKEEIYGIISQIRRASVSIATNISEGYGRNTTAQYIHFLGISKGSLSEVETLMVISSELGYVQLETCDSILERITELNKMLKKLIQVLEQKSQSHSR